MKRISSGTLGLALLLTIVLGGCNSKTDLPYESFYVPSKPYQIGSDRSNSFDGYAAASVDCMKRAQNYTDQASFREFERTAIIKLTAPSISKLVSATKLNSNFIFVPSDPFLPTTYHGGWTMLGRVLSWRITDEGEKSNWNEVARLGVAGVKFGTDITGGGANDAILGHWIVSETRKGLAPFLPHMDSASLSTLATGVSKALESAPKYEQTLINEQQNMLAGVQFIQDAYQNGDFSLLEQAMYKEVREAIDYLKGLDAKERPEYFRGFAAEAKNEIAFATEQASMPTSERKEFKLDTRVSRPWKRFAKQLFGTLGPLTESNDMFLARTRLLALTASALAVARQTGTAPKDLDFAKGDLTTDPYSGRPFPYHAAGREFRIYSVGADCRDDGGDSSLDGKEPDLLLDPAPF